MVTLLSKLLIKNNQEVKNPAVRQAYGMLCGGVGIFLNLILFACKALAGLISGSIAITADAFNNLSDAGSSIITLVGFKMAGQKPDSDHPFGHGRIEYISGFLVAIIILIMAFELLQSSVQKILHPVSVESGTVVYVILIVSILVKIYMYLYNHRISKKIDSEAMNATAKDSLSDSLATFVVLLSMLVAEKLGVSIDGYAGLVVAGFVFMAGYSAAKDTINPLLGQPPEPEFVKQVESMIMEYKENGVLGIHDLVIHNYGPGRVMLSVHVEVPSTGNIMVLHDMIDNIEHRLARELQCSAVIHMDPICIGDEKTEALKQMVKEIIDSRKEGLTFHDFRIVEGPTHTNIIFDVVASFEVKKEDKELISELQEKIHALSTEEMEYFAVITVDRESI